MEKNEITTKIEITTKLADAMIKEIKDNKLEIKITEYCEDMEDFCNNINKIFALKLFKLLLNSEEIQDKLTEDEKGELEILKNILK